MDHGHQLSKDGEEARREPGKMATDRANSIFYGEISGRWRVASDGRPATGTRSDPPREVHRTRNGNSIGTGYRNSIGTATGTRSEPATGTRSGPATGTRSEPATGTRSEPATGTRSGPPRELDRNPPRELDRNPQRELDRGRLREIYWELYAVECVGAQVIGALGGERGDDRRD